MSYNPDKQGRDSSGHFSGQGSSNGAQSQQTTAQLKAFQKAHGLKQTGEFDAPTRSALKATASGADKKGAAAARKAASARAKARKHAEVEARKAATAARVAANKKAVAERKAAAEKARAERKAVADTKRADAEEKKDAAQKEALRRLTNSVPKNTLGFYKPGR